ncbi:uncharacterized protein LOC124928030 [Impatiens glandulifera]|uniref:uncharacterized protein LOC124928030 n=1 Tax=Impatiens glandulifera TaxID=253017 RepID=UPI001FB050B3|nr:uncharacterized protein LOC124928030 [Impatiens glandulifera]XP_047324511.1 uncharacterized protein LOC124928030 [Impatiens glandulifera]XP_047324512.1 uncharacterized protein LOC124928030 [Impatiens glandulifera]
MQGGRGRGGDPFFNFGDSFGGFGNHGNLLSGFFGGRDQFEDPFFTQPLGSMFPSTFFGPPMGPSMGPPMGPPFMNPHASGFLQHDSPQPKKQRGPIIEELNSDDEKEDDKNKAGNSGKVPYVEDPDNVEDKKRKQMYYKHDASRNNMMQSQPQTRSFSFQSSTVTYGGANGAYYTSSSTRRAGSDGVTFEESKEANTMTGQASHRISRGIFDKGHSLTRKLTSDGRVDNMQTLHNLNEDEIHGFEEAWKVNGDKHMRMLQQQQPGWNRSLSLGGAGDMGGSGSGGVGGGRLLGYSGQGVASDESCTSPSRPPPNKMRASKSSRGRSKSATAADMIDNMYMRRKN